MLTQCLEFKEEGQRDHKSMQKEKDPNVNGENPTGKIWS